MVAAYSSKYCRVLIRFIHNAAKYLYALFIDIYGIDIVKRIPADFLYGQMDVNIDDNLESFSATKEQRMLRDVYELVRNVPAPRWLIVVNNFGC
jgi:hypothetical protein